MQRWGKNLVAERRKNEVKTGEDLPNVEMLENLTGLRTRTLRKQAARLDSFPDEAVI